MHKHEKGQINERRFSPYSCINNRYSIIRRNITQKLSIDNGGGKGNKLDRSEVR